MAVELTLQFKQEVTATRKTNDSKIYLIQRAQVDQRFEIG